MSFTLARRSIYTNSVKYNYILDIFVPVPDVGETQSVTGVRVWRRGLNVWTNQRPVFRSRDQSGPIRAENSLES